MFIAHVSKTVAESHVKTGPIITALYNVIREKKLNPDVTEATKGSYTVRQNQLVKYLFAHNLQTAEPEIFDDRKMTEFVRSLRLMGYSSHVVRKIQDLLIEVLTECRYMGLIDKIPKKAKIKHSEPQIIFLTPEELTTLTEWKFSERLGKVRDLFLMQCYSGVAYADLPRLNKNLLTHIDGIPVLQEKRQKADKVPFTIPLLPELKILLEKHDWKPPKLCIQVYNRYLKEIAAITEIDKNLTTHTGRKTCAMLYLRITGNYDATAAVLGHKDSSITRKHYAPYLPMHLIDALKKAKVFIE